MKFFNSDERRSIKRASLITFCPVKFSCNGQQFEALMLNASNSGAGFRLDNHGARPQLEIGAEIEYAIHTPYGPSTCKGRVVWIGEIDGYYSWGVEFTALSEDRNDPFNNLIDSSF